MEPRKDIDLALLIDGLQAEREQGITIDVAYRFETQKCKFIVADMDMNNIHVIWQQVLLILMLLLFVLKVF